MGRILIILVIIFAVLGGIIWHHNSNRHDNSGKLADDLKKYADSSFNPEVRVHLTTRREVPFEITGEYEIHSLDDHRLLTSGKKMSKTTLSQLNGKIHAGNEVIDSDSVEVSVKKSPGIWVNRNYYHGKIRLFAKPNGKLEVVNVVRMRDYIASVIDSEMPGNFPKEARAAQAIIARTYALYQMENQSSGKTFDLYNSTRSQKYLGYQYRDRRGRLLAGESSSSREIAEITAGVVCTHNGHLFCTYYSAVCGGKTDDGKIVFSDAAPPVKSVPCKWCKDARYFHWTVRMSRSSFNNSVSRYLRREGSSLSNINNIESGESLDYFKVGNGERTVLIKTRALKPYLSSANLLSPKYQIKTEKDSVVIQGFGHGHCVGLCQWGSRGLALTGKSTEEILGHYYPGSELVNLSEKQDLVHQN